jgi:hypothetical protein
MVQRDDMPSQESELDVDVINDVHHRAALRSEIGVEVGYVADKDQEVAPSRAHRFYFILSCGPAGAARLVLR